MNRIKHLIFTIVPAAALIYGSFLCSRHGQCLQDLSEGSLFLFLIGIAIMLISFIGTCLLIKSAHPESTLLHATAFSACIAALIYSGIHLITASPFSNRLFVLPAETATLFFSLYLILFGISLIYFLIKT